METELATAVASTILLLDQAVHEIEKVEPELQAITMPHLKVAIICLEQYQELLILNASK